MDGTLRKRIKNYPPWRAVRGRAKIAWKSPEARKSCIEYETNFRNRWKKVEEYRELYERGDRPEYEAVFAAPSLTGNPNCELELLDGMRRILANLESKRDEVDVVVLTAICDPPQAVSS